MRSARWPLERVLFALAGTVTLVSVALALTVSAWFLALTVAVGLNQWAYVLTGNCPAGLLLGRLGVRRGADWRRPDRIRLPQHQ
jgi:hypothetical protein